ncbi:uncharacterized protein FIBRA_06284 [Fibroporia radiculosa]|uniref:GSKIP domain-containing protein n=1 Tax=Fibroporia radiculosa TaxID=599839 RepID=J4GB15_9APHY|nr:uncharacterized protein FIBRA_06284 [Fibroporia radiculosa]CCM04123.1 predicted protein [Fibroporia radiculosa]
MSEEPSGFPAQELTDALKEHSFGLHGFELMSKDPYEAVSRVDLLEGSSVMISLSARGYKLESGSEERSNSASMDMHTLYESVEYVLMSVSPLYVAARQSILFAKLEALS